MAQYPVSNNQGIIDGLNYVLSGPSGLGQNFSGFSAYLDGYLTGNFRRPFTQASVMKTADGFSGEFTISIAPDTSGIIVGMNVTGSKIGAGATVTVINGTTITLSVANTGDMNNKDVVFSPSTIPQLYVAPFSLSNAEQLDDRTIKYTFTTPQASPPFALGNGLSVSGITPTTYNSSDLADAGYSIYQIGVVECTTTYVIVRTVAPIVGSLGTYVSGGSIEYSSMGVSNSTDCDTSVIVTGGQDRVFISGQLDQTVSYTCTGTADMTVYVDINRYSAFTNNDVTNPDFYFNFEQTVAEKTYTFTGLTGTGTLDVMEAVFASIFDTPVPGYYRYILEVYFEDTSSVGNSIQVTEDLLNLRGISVQVIKP